MNKTYVLRAFMETPWAILPSKLAELEEIVVRHVSGDKLTAEEIQAQIHGAERPADRRVQSVAVLPLFGTIFPRANMMTQMSGATSAERFGKAFASLLNDPEVDAIILDVDSPGGQVGGVDEVSQQIFNARGRKPIIAVANHWMASAAYWIGSSADELVVSPSSEVGSIGVFAVHEDMSKALEQEGVKVSIIKAGKYKAESNPYEPLTPEAVASIQESVNTTYDAFVSAVARNRGVDVSTVRNGFGEGRMVNAKQAVQMGMADRIGTLDETISRLLNQKTSELAEGGQEPAAAIKPTDEARARLASVGIKESIEGAPIMLRELIKARAEKIERAQALADIADKESRDFTPEERAEFAALLGEGESAGEIGELDAKIERIQGERDKLRSAAEKKFVTSEAQKPEETKAANTMKRVDFDKLSPDMQSAYIKGGGKLQD